MHSHDIALYDNLYSPQMVAEQQEK